MTSELSVCRDRYTSLNRNNSRWYSSMKQNEKVTSVCKDLSRIDKNETVGSFRAHEIMITSILYSRKHVAFFGLCDN